MRIVLGECKYLPLFLIGRAPSYQDEYDDYDDPIYAGSVMCFVLLWAGLTTFFCYVYPEKIDELVTGNMPSLSASFLVGIMSMVIYLIVSYLLVALIIRPFELWNAKQRYPRNVLDKSVPPSF
jgi:hypothetical protein